jgi:hypothetical protein
MAVAMEWKKCKADTNLQVFHATLEPVGDDLDLRVTFMRHQSEVDQVRLLRHRIDFLASENEDSSFRVFMAELFLV